MHQRGGRDTEAATEHSVYPADDQRFDTIHALGNAEIRTPNLDRLVQRGFVFDNTYCQGGMIGAVCAPSRTMLLPGKSLFRIPSRAANSYDGPMLPGVFNHANYVTLHVGKPGNSFPPAHQSSARAWPFPIPARKPVNSPPMR